MRPFNSTTYGLDRRLLVGLVILLAVSFLVVTWISIHESRSDSLRLLQLQGSALTEALAQAAENTLSSEIYTDYLVHLRYNEIIKGVDVSSVTDESLMRTAMNHDLHAIYILDSYGNVIHSANARSLPVSIPQFVVDEAVELLSLPEQKYILLLDAGDHPGGAVHYNLQLTNDLSGVVVLVADALYYVEGVRQTQIGYLAQNMAKEEGVEYILYQSTDGIIFSSCRISSLLAIESDPFLSDALRSDSIMSRQHEFQGREVLELVRPFSSKTYPFGLLRVGLSLESYSAISSRFDRLMIGLGGALFGLLVIVLLYINSRRKRKQIAREYDRIKTVTDRIFDQMQTGVATIDNKGFITLANEAFESTFGCVNAIGSTWDEIVQAPELKFANLPVGSQGTIEKEINITADNRRRSLLLALSRLEPEAGSVSGVIAVVYDVTHQKGLERDSARKERLSEMGNLAAGVAHEIRNPLNAISIAAQRLASEFNPTDDHDEYNAITVQVQNEARRLNDIITRFLALAREDKERQKTINLGETIAEIVQLLRAEADESGIEISTRIEPDIEIDADPDSIKQVITNLFNNSKEALCGQPGAVVIAAKFKGNSVVILFADTGPGIGGDIRDEIFQPYFTTKEGGTGLGLPTVHRIISELGGDIGVLNGDFEGAPLEGAPCEGAPCEGVAFVISIPKK